jgi:hypothetical protein
MDVMFTFSDHSTLFYHDVKVALDFTESGDFNGMIYSKAPIVGIHDNVLIELVGENIRHEKIGKVIIQKDRIEIGDSK